MEISGAGTFAGDGVFSVQYPLVERTISFTIYDSSLPATMTGDAPSIPNKFPGSTFLIPTQGNMTRTEIRYQSPPGGGQIQQIPVNIPLHGWTDGSALYFPGDTYTMPNTNVTFTAIWQNLYSPSLTTSEPYTVSYGDTVTITGFNLGSTSNVRFSRRYSSPTITIINDNMITAVVPQGAIGNQNNPGVINLSLIGGGTGFIYDAYEIV
jgi:hypothetical protein